MKFLSKLKVSLLDRAAKGVAASLTVLLVWAAYQIAPVVLPAIEDFVSKRVLLALFVSSLTLNLIFLILVWINSKGNTLRLKYGIYWDKQKNPHCPSCKKPISGYNNYKTYDNGYYCRPCNKIFPLEDATGRKIEPAKAISEL